MKVCNPIELGCEECYSIELNQSDLTIDAGLTPASTPYLWITDKFGNQYRTQIIVDGDGAFEINPALYPSGMFNFAAGSFDLFLSSDLDGAIIIPLYFSIDYVLTEFQCIELIITGDPSCDPIPPDLCAMAIDYINNLESEIKECVLQDVCEGGGPCDPALVRNTDSSYSQQVASGGTLILQDITFDVYVNGVLNQSAILPAAVNNTINIS